MTKTITVDLTEKVEGRKGTPDMTVEEALAWVDEHSEEDEETGETNAPSPGALIVYAVKRMMALHSDNKRVKRGAPPEHIYVARTDGVRTATEAAKALREKTKTDLGRMLHGEAPKKADKKGGKAA